MSTPVIDPQITLPADEGINGFLSLFESDWVWHTYCSELGEPEDLPRRIRAIQLNYRPGRRACVSYSAEWNRGKWIQEDRFAIELTDTGSKRFFRYPDDPHLPGLSGAASPIDADLLLARYTSSSFRRPLVQIMRYRPGSRAVLRYTSRQEMQPLFVRVVPPERIGRWLSAADLASKSGFQLPRILGYWEEGGLVWLTGVPGESVRQRIHSGTPPDPASILDGLANLWSSEVDPQQGRTLDILSGFKMTEGLLSHVIPASEQHLVHRLADVLGPFCATWRPSALAHNDFHDDQVVLTPQGRLALVDFDEIGLGDPLLDVANLMAHLRWMARFRNAPEECQAYHRLIRNAALNRFDWDPQDLNMLATSKSGTLS